MPTHYLTRHPPVLNSLAILPLPISARPTIYKLLASTNEPLRDINRQLDAQEFFLKVQEGGSCHQREYPRAVIQQLEEEQLLIQDMCRTSEASSPRDFDGNLSVSLCAGSWIPRAGHDVNSVRSSFKECSCIHPASMGAHPLGLF